MKILFLFICASMGFSAQSGDFEKKIDQSFVRNRVLTQLYRWYTFYENDSCLLDNQVNILASGIKVQSSLGQSIGIKKYKKRVQSLPKAWENAHHVLNTEVKMAEHGGLQLEADILYQNLDKKRNLRAHRLHYVAQLSDSAHLPIFQSIKIEATGSGEGVPFVHAYAKNRALSLAHYWLSLIEARGSSASTQPFKEILHDEFEMLLYGGSQLSGLNEFSRWYEGSKGEIKMSGHDIEFFEVTKGQKAGQYVIEMELSWRGINKNNVKLDARSRHSWLIVDKPSLRFAKIKQIKIKMIKDFAPVSSS